jgi:drug/metabolite transporter (DMT)-like permease
MRTFLIVSVPVVAAIFALAGGALVAFGRKRDGLASVLALSAAVVFAGALICLDQLGEVGAQ